MSDPGKTDKEKSGTTKLREELAQWQKRTGEAEAEAKALRKDLEALSAQLATITEQLANNPLPAEAKKLREEMEQLKAELADTTDKLETALKTQTMPPANPPKKDDKAAPGSQTPKEPNAPQPRKRPVPFV